MEARLRVGFAVMQQQTPAQRAAAAAAGLFVRVFHMSSSCFWLNDAEAYK